jgi:hypothetical protein
MLNNRFILHWTISCLHILIRIRRAKIWDIFSNSRTQTKLRFFYNYYILEIVMGILGSDTWGLVSGLKIIGYRIFCPPLRVIDYGTSCQTQGSVAFIRMIEQLYCVEGDWATEKRIRAVGSRDMPYAVPESQLVAPQGIMRIQDLWSSWGHDDRPATASGVLL